MSNKIGFIGAGNMVSAILNGILQEHLVEPANIWLSNRSPEKLEKWSAVGVHTTLDNAIVAQNADLIVLGVKPQMMDAVLPQVAPCCSGKGVLSIAAGISSATLRAALPGAMVVRAIPNTPLMLGKGATVVAEAPDVPREVFDTVCSLFTAAGTIAVIPESQIDDFLAVSGSSPAFFFRMVQAITEAASARGIDKALALRMASQTMAGSAAMLLESGRTASELIRQVCSPGGTTLAALTAFDDYRFEDMMDQAAARCAQRSRELGR